MNPSFMRKGTHAVLALVATAFCLSGCSSHTPLANSVSLNRQAPEGWELRGRDVAIYRVDTDANEMRRGVASTTLLSTQASPQQFALLAQEVDAAPYRGARVRFSGYLKSVDVPERTFLWLRVDSEAAIGLAFDDMHLRPLNGTTRWHVYEVLVDVPAQATVLRMGAGLIGSGQIWLNDCLLEIVPEKFASTDRRLAPVSNTQGAEDRFWPHVLDLRSTDP